MATRLDMCVSARSGIWFRRAIFSMNMNDTRGRRRRCRCATSHFRYAVTVFCRTFPYAGAGCVRVCVWVVRGNCRSENGEEKIQRKIHNIMRVDKRLWLRRSKTHAEHKISTNNEHDIDISFEPLLYGEWIGWTNERTHAIIILFCSSLPGTGMALLLFLITIKIIMAADRRNENE